MIFFVYVCELFPVEIRNAGVGLSCMVSKLFLLCPGVLGSWMTYDDILKLEIKKHYPLVICYITMENHHF